MKYRLVLLEPVSDTGSFGEDTPSYREFRTVAAERVKTSGSRSEEASISPTIVPSSTSAMLIR